MPHILDFIAPIATFWSRKSLEIARGKDGSFFFLSSVLFLDVSATPQAASYTILYCYVGRHTVFFFPFREKLFFLLLYHAPVDEETIDTFSLHLQCKNNISKRGMTFALRIQRAEVLHSSDSISTGEV